jgi:hypothetical protein
VPPLSPVLTPSYNSPSLTPQPQRAQSFGPVAQARRRATPGLAGEKLSPKWCAAPIIGVHNELPRPAPSTSRASAGSFPQSPLLHHASTPPPLPLARPRPAGAPLPYRRCRRATRRGQTRAGPMRTTTARGTARARDGAELAVRLLDSGTVTRRWPEEHPR